MTQLKEIRIMGFKSFGKKSSLKIQSNLQGLVGPNGCGKSNLVDAIRWILGESSTKSLRAQHPTDILFSGSKNTPSSNYAEVSLCFENSEKKIITLTKRLFRDQEREYLVNGETKRLKDLKESFQELGLLSKNFTVIAQERRDQIIQANPRELCELIEESAGIESYKEKKKFSEKQLGETKEHLQEIKKQERQLEEEMRDLQEQARHLEKKETILKNIKELETQIFFKRYQQTETKRSQLQLEQEEEERKRIQLKRILEEEEKKQEEEKNQLQQKREKQKENEQTLTQSETKKNFYLKEKKETEEQIQFLEKKILELENQTNHLPLLSSPTEEDLTKIQNQIEEKENQINQMKSQENKWEAEIHSLRETLAKEKIKGEEIKFEIQSKQLEIKQILQEKKQQEFLLEQIKKQEEALEKIQQEKATLQKEETRLNNQIQSLQEETKPHVIALQKVKQELHDHQKELSQAEKELTRSETQIQFLQQSNFEKISQEYETFLKREHLKTVEQVLNPYQQNKLQPYEKFFPHILKAMIVKNQEEAENLIKKAQSINCPLDFLISNPSLSLEETISQIIQNLINQYEVKPNHSLLHKTNQILSYRPQNQMQNEFYDFLHRKKSCESKQIQQKKQIQSLSLIQKQLNEKKRTTLFKIKELEEKEKKWFQKQNRQKIQIRILEEKIKSNEIPSHFTPISFQEIQEKQNKIEKELLHLEASFQEQKSQIQEKEQEQETKKHNYNLLKEEKQKLNQEQNLLKQEFFEQNQRKKNWLFQKEEREKQKEIQNQFLKERKKEKEEKKIKKNQLNQNIKEIETKIANTQAVLEKEKEAEKNLENKQNQTQKKLKEKEKQWIQITERQKYLKEKWEQENQKWDFLTKEKASFPENLTFLPKELESLSSLQEKRDQQEKTLSKIGPVNERSLTELKKKAEKIQWIQHQRKEIEDSVLILEKSLKTLEERSEKKFQSFFQTLQKEFSEIFQKLFPLGESQLELNQKKDQEEKEVHLKVKLPGKKLQHLNLLSGGERALISISLIFAFLQSSPSPFCVLDEVDAPLDQKNLNRFLTLLKSLQEKFQFLIITHNPRTMTELNHLNGVTMMEPGLSEIIPANLAKFKEKKKNSKSILPNQTHQ